MIEGAGIDLIDVERIIFNIEKDAGFKEMIFSDNEIGYCESKANKYEHYAARFAAKEAFLKALGTGWIEETQFNEIEITNTSTGKPELILKGKTKETLHALQITRILVSLSHLKTMACAVVIIEK
ncbi:MAG: holo-ACP synthase [Ferruginibacter sp.]